MAKRSSKDPLSPCIGVCTLDPLTQHCTGCLRSLAEIAGWSRYSVQEKRQVLAELEKRRASLINGTFHP